MSVIAALFFTSILPFVLSAKAPDASGCDGQHDVAMCMKNAMLRERKSHSGAVPPRNLKDPLSRHNFKYEDLLIAARAERSRRAAAAHGTKRSHVPASDQLPESCGHATLDLQFVHPRASHTRATHQSAQPSLANLQ